MLHVDKKLPLTFPKGSEEGPRYNVCAGMVGMHPPPFPKHMVKHIQVFVTWSSLVVDLNFRRKKESISILRTKSKS